MRERLRIAAFAILIAGLGVALGIYIGAGDDVPAGAFDALYGSKRYVRDLQLYGGKASVLFDEFMRWFGSLWEGRRLAGSVAVLTLAVSGALYAFSGRARD
jgi:hypothetical protein